MKNSIYISLVILFLAFTLENGENNYIQQIEAKRKEKNKEFKDKERSPLPAEKIKKFKGLSYFEIDENYKVNAIFIKNENPVVFKMKTSTERLPEYAEYGKVQFKLLSISYILTVYQNQDLIKKEGYEDYLFLPFTDLTSGEESYGGGRYLDLRIPEDSTIIIDFNLSYNPYCAYNHKYSCPIPPKENFIETRIAAGEKNFEK